MRKEAGFTLIEVLISVTLLTFVATGILIAMRVSLDAVGHADTKLMHNRRVMGVLRIMEAQVSDMMLVGAKCRSVDAQQPGPEAVFFQGETQTMRFVSSYTLNENARGVPKIVEYRVIPRENGNGVRLVVNEHPWAGEISAGMFCTGLQPDPVSGVMLPVFGPVQIGPGSFVLADNLAACHFEYLQPRDPQANLPPRWVAHWTRQVLPNAVRLDLAPLDPVAGQLQLQALTVPVRVNRDPAVKYGD